MPWCFRCSCTRPSFIFVSGSVCEQNTWGVSIDYDLIAMSNNDTHYDRRTTLDQLWAPSLRVRCDVDWNRLLLAIRLLLRISSRLLPLHTTGAAKARQTTLMLNQRRGLLPCGLWRLQYKSEALGTEITDTQPIDRSINPCQMFKRKGRIITPDKHIRYFMPVIKWRSSLAVYMM